MLADRADLSARYGPVVAGLGAIAASLEGQELDKGVLGGAFSANWNLGAAYPAELAGRAFFTAWTRVVFVAIGLALPSRQQLVAVQGLDWASDAAAAWPSDAHVGSSVRLVDFEPACRQKAEDELRKGGLPALRRLTQVQIEQYRQAAERLIG
ncbi:hypothetical protein [Streptomyces virginiae]|uniref:hypothetical protein n=1 Tax=Streptomyces virginiae TaxID=1961 RepID=UPI000525075B|nr:hypothetical protein [Streptomyces virginiae]